MKGQIKQAFTFILFILIAGFVVIIGYNAITGGMESGCQAERATFSQKITNFFDSYDDYGSVHRESLKLPCDYRMICFVDAGFDDPSQDLTVSGTPLEGRNEEIKVIETARDVKKNIFLIGEFAEPIGYSEKINVTPDDKPLCIEQTGTVDLVFEGLGQSTRVEEG